jgi:PhnB protein
MSIQAIAERYETLTPYLIVRDAAGAMEYYKKAFGATELFRMAHPSGKLLHAELQIGKSRVMLADEFPEINARSPQSYGGSPVGLLLYVDDVDGFYERAVEAGARAVRPVQNQFYGDRSGGLEDPFGHIWHVATRLEDVTPDEMRRRYAEAMGHNL